MIAGAIGSNFGEGQKIANFFCFRVVSWASNSG